MGSGASFYRGRRGREALPWWPNDRLAWRSRWSRHWGLLWSRQSVPGRTLERAIEDVKATVNVRRHPEGVLADEEKVARPPPLNRRALMNARLAVGHMVIDLNGQTSGAILLHNANREAPTGRLSHLEGKGYTGSGATVLD